MHDQATTSLIILLHLIDDIPKAACHQHPALEHHLDLVRQLFHGFVLLFKESLELQLGCEIFKCLGLDHQLL